MNLNYLITAVPRSATKFMAKLFCSAGIPCGHESYFGMPGIGDFVKNEKAESSWLAAPFLDQSRFSNTKIIHIVRDPLEVIPSLTTRIFLENGRPGNLQLFTKFAYLNTPGLLNEPGLDKYIHFWIKWNEMIEQHAGTRYKIEQINKDPHDFFLMIGKDTTGVSLYNKKNTNASGNKEDIPIETLKQADLYPNLKKKAANYGYELP